MLRKAAEADRGEAGLCPVPVGSGRRGEAHPQLSGRRETEILFKETANTGTYLHSVTGKVPSSQLPNTTRSTREIMTKGSLGHWSNRREEASRWHTRHRCREGQQERRLGSLPVHDERRAAGNPGLFGVTGVGVCAGDSPSLCSLICMTQLFDASLLCPRHLTLDKPFCSVGEHGEEESGHFQVNFVIPMSVR